MTSITNRLLDRTFSITGNNIPSYYRDVLTWIYRILAVYCTIHFVVGLFWFRHSSILYLTPVMVGMFVLLIFFLQRISMRINLIIYGLITVVWCQLYIRDFGWGIGGQHFIIPFLIVVFFSVFETRLSKLVFCGLMLIFRITMYGYCLSHTPLYPLDDFHSTVMQTINTFALFILIGVICSLFSSNIQSAEIELLRTNQELRVAAGTDPLTGLPNRRSLLNEMHRFKKANPSSNFAISIADIDFFKRVNDTYGHACGDYLLKELAKLFLERTSDQGSVCRWGGEEFCFFFPNLNLDEACSMMLGITHAVEQMRLEYEGNTISFTITAGVEENDFVSDIDKLVELADTKLYIGKENGRNQVVM